MYKSIILVVYSLCTTYNFEKKQLSQIFQNTVKINWFLSLKEFKNTIL